ncbi:HSP20-like chaperone [Tribonema minus]|uniref:HSP20-like chaperone n=1 Tax=Tribonema minus TaxID=303371 RepID=A0A835YR38_9STRA|nr:HSP20-like chaperone [Tribonema minus]
MYYTTTTLAFMAVCGMASSFLPSTASFTHGGPVFAKAADPSSGGSIEKAPEQQKQLSQQQQNALRALGPFAPMRRFVDIMDQMERSFFGDEDVFGGMMAPFAEQGEGALTPSRWALPNVGQLDISETDKEVNVSIDLPGLKKEDINVELSKGLLTIRAERKEEHETKDKQFMRKERSFGVVERIVRVPDTVDSSQSHVKANFKDGVLHVTLEKTPHISSSGPRRIDIQ